VDKLPGETISVLQQMLQDSQPNVRQGAAIALANAKIGNLNEIIPVLIEGVDSGEFQVPCAKALGGIGSSAKPALPALEKRLAEPSSVLRRAAVQAMNRIKSE
jgi:HEAT repeat protein